MINFDLENTLFCGQSFCWRREVENYVAVLNNKVYRINNKSNISDPYLINYLDMKFNYNEVLNKMKSMDSVLKQAVETCNEIHILNQDLWETIICFILSQNNNIKRIEGIYDTLCKTYGNEVEKGYFTFPRPEQMKNVSEKELRDLKVGFRAPYILDAINNSDLLLTIDKMDSQETDIILKKIKGI